MIGQAPCSSGRIPLPKVRGPAKTAGLRGTQLCPTTAATREVAAGTSATPRCAATTGESQDWIPADLLWSAKGFEREDMSPPWCVGRHACGRHVPCSWFSVRPYQDALAAELAARQASLVGLREAALSAKQEALCQSGRLREEQTAGQRAEQRCAQLAEECKQKSGRYDQVLQQLAQQDRDIAMHRFEAASTSRRVEQTQADSQVVREDLRVESQRHLLAQSELHDLEKALQAAVSQLRLFDQEAEHLQQAEKKHEVMEMDAEILSIQEMVSTVHQEKHRAAQSLGHVEDDCQKLDSQMHTAQQDLLRVREANEQQVAETKAKAALCDSMRGMGIKGFWWILVETPGHMFDTNHGSVLTCIIVILITNNEITWDLLMTYWGCWCHAMTTGLLTCQATSTALKGKDQWRQLRLNLVANASMKWSHSSRTTDSTQSRSGVHTVKRNTFPGYLVFELHHPWPKQTKTSIVPCILYMFLRIYWISITLCPLPCLKPHHRVTYSKSIDWNMKCNELANIYWTCIDIGPLTRSFCTNRASGV